MRALRNTLLLTVVALAGCGPKTLELRMAHGERLAGEADTTLDEAEAQLRAVDPDGAEKLIAEAERSLEDPDVDYYPERGMLRDRIARDRAQLPQVRAEKAARELAIAIDKQRQALAAPASALRSAAPKLEEPMLGVDDVKSARSAAKDLASVLDDGKPFEARDAAYAGEAKGLYALVARTEARAAVAERLVAFREQVAVEQTRAQATLAKLKGAKAPGARAKLLGSAVEDFRSCEADGQRMVLDTPEIERARLDVGGQVSTPGAIIKSCGAQLQPLQRKLAAAQHTAPGSKAKKRRH